MSAATRAKETQPRKIAVTGSSGSLGEAVIDQLIWNFPDAKIVGLDKHPPHRKRDPKRFTFVQCDVRDQNLPSRLEGCDAVIHLAFIVDKTGGLTPQEIESINVFGTQNVFTAGVGAGVNQFVYASSIAAYGMHPEYANILLTEDMPLRGNPDFFYSNHKAMVERWLDGFEKDHSKVRIARLRPCIFMGERSPTRPARFLAFTPLIPSIRGFEHVRFQLAHEDDIAAAFSLALAKKAHGAFNLAADQALNLPGVASEMGKWTLPLPKAVLNIGALAFRWGLSPWDPDWLIKASRSNVAMSTDKAKNELGWTPKYSTAGAVLRAVVGKA